ncbi:hypothetical protein ACVWXO_002578 [Bradyrhizobium sp. LM2.7]
MKYVYILESLDSAHFYVGIRTTYGPGWRNITPARCRTPRNMGLGEFGPISRLMTRLALLRLNDI